MIKPAYYFVSSEASNEEVFLLIILRYAQVYPRKRLYNYLNLHIAALFLLDDNGTAFIESSTKFKV